MGYPVKRSLCYWVIGMMVGIFLARFFPVPIWIHVIGMLVSLIISLVIGRKQIKTVMLWSIFLFLGSFLWAIDQLPAQLLVSLEGENIEIEGTIQVCSPYKYSLVMDVERINGKEIPIDAKINIRKQYGDESLYSRGSEVRFYGELVPFSTRTNPGDFCEESYLASQGIHYSFDASKPGELVQEATGMIAFANTIQEYIAKEMEKYLSEESYGVVYGLLFGDKGLMDDEFYRESQQLGIAHVFAVSGLHIGFVVSFLLALLYILQWERSRGAIILCCVVLGIYCVITNFTPSALRATIMAILVLVANRYYRYKDIYTLLAIAALLILLGNPGAMWSIGFQLSFVSTLGIVYFFSLAKRMVWFIPWQGVANAIAVSLAAQIASAPFVAYYFYVFTPWAPLFNILIVPMVSIAVPLILTALLMGLLFSWISPFIYLVVDGILQSTFMIIEFAEKMIASPAINIGQPSILAICGYFLVCIFWREEWDKALFNCRGWWNRGIVVIGIALLLSTSNGKDVQKLTVLDVGQGNSAVLSVAGNSLVFDGGPTKNTTVKYLQYEGINKISMVVLSHPDLDHINGLMAVVDEVEVDTLVIPPYCEESEVLQELLFLAQEKQVQIIEGHHGLMMNIGKDIYIEFLLYGEETDSINNKSLVSVIEVEEKTMVLPGDLDWVYIDEVIQDVGQVDVWLVPHHGSKNSYEDYLYEEFTPNLAIISAGKDNRYGHPHPQVIEGLREGQIPYIRTDEHGAVQVMIENEEILVEVYLNHKFFQKQ